MVFDIQNTEQIDRMLADKETYAEENIVPKKQDAASNLHISAKKKR